MLIGFDTEADCAYMYLKEEIEDGEARQNLNDLVDPTDLAADIVVDLDENGHLLGMEILGASNLVGALAVDADGPDGQCQFPVYLDAARDLLRVPLVPNERPEVTRVVRLGLPTDVAGRIGLHIDNEGRLLCFEVGRASEFVHPDALEAAIRV